MTSSSSFMTLEELLALPDDGIDRELIRGELREYPITTHSAPNSRAMANLTGLIWSWWTEQPQPRGGLYTGDVRILVQRNPDTLVGMDLAYVSPELTSRTADDALFLDGLPILAVEILSPSDTIEGITEKTQAYLDAGGPLVWEVNPFSEVVAAYRPGLPPELFNATHELTAEPHLPGLRIRGCRDLRDVTCFPISQDFRGCHGPSCFTRVRRCFCPQPGRNCRRDGPRAEGVDDRRSDPRGAGISTGHGN